MWLVCAGGARDPRARARDGERGPRGGPRRAGGVGRGYGFCRCARLGHWQRHADELRAGAHADHCQRCGRRTLRDRTLLALTSARSAQTTLCLLSDVLTLKENSVHSEHHALPRKPCRHRLMYIFSCTVFCSS